MGILVALLTTGCSFEHCVKVGQQRDDTRASLCESKCRCVSPENFEPIPLERKVP